MGVRTCLCYEISDRDGMDKARAAVMENASWIKHALADDTDMIAGMMGMHAQFTISDETMELAAANKPAEVGYHIHVAEASRISTTVLRSTEENCGPSDGLQYPWGKDPAGPLHLRKSS